MTKKLYDLNGYETEFSARVVECKACSHKGEEGFAVVLDQTLFFPEEGGQSPDCGRLGAFEVLDVQIHKDKDSGEETITHYLKEQLPVGAEVAGKIDWDHRFSNMQQHSGEHIFSGIVHSTYGYDNVGFHLSDQIVTMDFNGVLTEEEVRGIEDRVNEAIIRNVPVTVSYPSKEELREMDYRSKIEIEGQVRIVTVEGYDVCACCAPHVGRTGEIGMLKVMSLQNYKGGVRISILCGFRALEAFREKAAVISRLTGLLTTGQDKLVDNVTKLKTANQSLKSQLSNVSGQLLEREIAELDPSLENVFLFKTGIEGNALRNTVNKLMEKYDGICGVFSGDEENGYAYVIGSKTRDCKMLAAALKEKLSARGGGSSQMIQGSVTAGEAAIRSALQTEADK